MHAAVKPVESPRATRTGPALAGDLAARQRALVALIAMMGVNTLIYSLSYPLFALVLDARGIDAESIGYSSAAQAGAVFAVAPFVPRLVGRFGPLPVIVCSLFATAAMFLLVQPLQSAAAWAMARFCLGATETTLWIAGESWVNQLAPERARGRAMAAYTMSLGAGFALGPLVLALTGAEGWTPFVVAAATVLLAGLPLLAVRLPADEMRDRATGSLLEVLRRAPVPMFTNLVFAATAGVLMTFFPLYGVQLGLDLRTALFLVSVGAVGGIALQPLTGRLADRMDRHLLLALLLGGSMAATCAMPLLVIVGGWNYAYQFVAFGLRTGIYSVSLTLMGERFRGVELASASALFNLMWGVGSLIGPSVGGHAMALSPDLGVPVSVVLLLALALPLPVAAWLRARRRGATRAG